MKTRAGLFDRLSLYVLKIAKRNKARASDPGYYETFFGDYHFEQYNEDIRHVLKHEEIRRAISMCGSPDMCLDLGCGVGHVMKIFPSGSKKIGIDYSVKSLDIAKRYLGDGFDFIQGTAEQIPMPDESIDLITCFEVLEHLKDDEKALVEMSRVVKKGGYLILSVPNSYYFHEYFDLIGHIRHYDRESIERVLNKAGFKTIEPLEMYLMTNKVYYFIYVGMEGVNRVVNKLTGRPKSIYQRRIPLTNKTMYRVLIRPVFMVIGKAEKTIMKKYQDKNSTFLIALKHA